MKNLLTKLTCCFSIAICFILIGCKKKETVHKEYYNDGTLMSIHNTIGHTIVGVSKIFHKNGKLFQIRKYKDGVIVDEKTYYNTGELESSVPYQNGEIHGQVRYFYKDGGLKRITSYRNGVMDGLDEHYYPNGHIFIETFRKKFPEEGYGFKHGRETVFNDNGTVITSGIYLYGNPWDGTFTSKRKDKLAIGNTESFMVEYEKGKFVIGVKLKNHIVKPWLSKPEAKTAKELQAEKNTSPPTPRR